MGSTTSKLELRHLKDPAVVWVTNAGVGYLRPAPGTWGSLAALALWWFWLGKLPLEVQLAIAAVYTAVSFALCSYVCRRYELDDAPQIVADEVAGMMLALVQLLRQSLLPHSYTAQE